MIAPRAQYVSRRAGSLRCAWRRCAGAPRDLNGSRNRGVALITAMLVTALASMMAISLAASQQLEIRRTGNVLDSDRAYAFALGVEGWVKHVLDRDNRQKDSLDEDWALTLPPIPVEGGTVAGRIEDMQSRFNINNLLRNDGERSQPDFEYFQRLLESLGLNPDLALAVIDWIDADMDPNFPGGAEDDTYLSADPPYRAANRPMVSTSELLLIKGFTREVYDTLAPYVTALPVRTPINVNTAPAPVLAALVEGLDSADAAFIIERRAEKSFDRIEDFVNQDEVRGKRIPPNMASVTSEFFMLNAVTQFGARAKVNLYSLITRRGGKVAVVMRAQGVY